MLRVRYFSTHELFVRSFCILQFSQVERLGAQLASGKLSNIVAVATSEATRKQAEELKIPLAILDSLKERSLDVAIDGADSVIIQHDAISDNKQ